MLSMGRTMRRSIVSAGVFAASLLAAPGLAAADPANQEQERPVELRKENSLGFSPEIMQDPDLQWGGGSLAWTRMTLSMPLGYSPRDSDPQLSLGLLSQLDPRDPAFNGSPEMGGALVSALGSFFTGGLTLRVAETRLFGEHRHFLRGYVGRGAIKLVWRIKF
jgi:hypothetical protein